MQVSISETRFWAQVSTPGASLLNPAHRCPPGDPCYAQVIPPRARQRDGTGRARAPACASTQRADGPKISPTKVEALPVCSKRNVCSTNTHEYNAQRERALLDTPRRVPGCRRSASLRVWKAVPPTLSVTQPRCWWPPFSSSARQLTEGTVSPPGPVSRRLWFMIRPPISWSNGNPQLLDATCSCEPLCFAWENGRK